MKPLHGANGILEAIAVAVNDVHIHLDAGAQHADRVGDAVLAIHQEMLADGVNDMVLGRQVNGLGVLNDVLHVFLRDLAVRGRHRVHATIVEAAHVAASDPEINAANFDIGHLLGLDNGVTHVLLGYGSVRDFALAHTPGAGLAEADDVQGAVGAQFADHGTDLGGADFQTNNDRGRIKHAFSWCGMFWGASETLAATHWLRASGPERCC